MRYWKRLGFYLLLNALVSVGATWAALSLWARTHPSPCGPGETRGAVAATPAPSATANGVARPQGTAQVVPSSPRPPTPAGDPQALEVAEVQGAGYLAEERVLLRYHGPGVLALDDWQMSDGRGHTFVFPALRLQSGGAVWVWTKAGADTAVELFWGLAQAVWSPGTPLTLRDATGRVVLTYTVP